MIATIKMREPNPKHSSSYCGMRRKDCQKLSAVNSGNTNCLNSIVCLGNDRDVAPVVVYQNSFIE